MATKILQEMESIKGVILLINELDKSFLKEHKRARRASLVYSQTGSIKDPIHNLAIWYTPDMKSEVEWFVKEINK